MRRRSGGAPAAHSGEGGETVGTEVDGGEDGALVVSGPQARTVVMGILNVTPDSFSDGNKFFDPAAAVGRMFHAEGGADEEDDDDEAELPEPVLRETRSRTKWRARTDRSSHPSASRKRGPESGVVKVVTSLLE